MAIVFLYYLIHHKKDFIHDADSAEHETINCFMSFQGKYNQWQRQAAIRMYIWVNVQYSHAKVGEKKAEFYKWNHTVSLWIMVNGSIGTYALLLTIIPISPFHTALW